MKNIFQLTILLFISLIGTAQTLPQANPTLPANWERVYIKDVGNIDIPPTMEVQSGNFKTFVDEQRKIKGYDATKITIQQAGLNEKKPESFNRYARIMLDTYFGTAGEYEKMNFNITQYSQSDIAVTNTEMKSQVIQGMAGTDLKLIEWFGTTIEKINGMSCIHWSYTRQNSSKPIVLVHMYMFYNYDRAYRLNFSYRVSEQNYWKTDYATILKSFRITNIK